LSGITHVYIPVHLYRLGLKGIAEISILALAASFGEKGLCMSNTSLAATLGINRKNIVAAVARLKKRGLIAENGGRKGHRLVASTEVKELSGGYEKTPAEVTEGNGTGYETPHITKGTEYELNTLSGGRAGSVAPSLKEVEDYVRDRNFEVDAASFHRYFSESGWVDSRGRKVRNWRQKAISWHSHGKGKRNGAKGDDIVRSFGGLKSAYGKSFDNGAAAPPVPLRDSP
jgi:biotin operon repressor